MRPNKTHNFDDPSCKKKAKSCHLLEESILCRSCRSVSPRSKGGRCATDSNSLKSRKPRKCAAAGGRGPGPPPRGPPVLSQCLLVLTKEVQSHVCGWTVLNKDPREREQRVADRCIRPGIMFRTLPFCKPLREWALVYWHEHSRFQVWLVILEGSLLRTE